MHAEERNFLDAILEHPDEIVHRLVYAVWLQEHGNAVQALHGEYIHACVSAEMIHPDGKLCEQEKCPCGEMFRRAVVLRMEQTRWMREANQLPPWALLRHRERLGFWDIVEVESADDWLAIGEDILQFHPIRALYIKEMTPNMVFDLLSLKATGRLRLVSIPDPVSLVSLFSSFPNLEINVRSTPHEFRPKPGQRISYGKHPLAFFDR